MKFYGVFAAAAAVLLLSGPARAEKPAVQYLAFQIFTGAFDSADMRQSLPPAPENLQKTVQDMRDRVRVPGPSSRRLGFIPGPISFDNTDDEVRQLIASSFDIALKTDMAVGFHIDDSMFWGRVRGLNRPGAIEWLDWSGTPNTGRRLDWSSQPTKIMPQLCLNSKAVSDLVKNRGALIGDEVQKGLKRLHDADKDDLFIGVIAGWETHIGRDFKTGKPLGFCALSNKGFSAQKPPEDFDRARMEVVRDFIDLWAQALEQGGVPGDKIYAHAAFMSETVFDLVKNLRPDDMPSTYLQVINATPPEVAFGPAHLAGFSTYPEPGKLEQIYAALKKQRDPPWASSEGTAIAPDAAEQGRPGTGMEGYLGNLFNHGARLVNIFGWGVGRSSNPFRKTAEEDSSIAAYRKFLSGDLLEEAPVPVPEVPSAAWMSKIRGMQQRLPGYIARNGIAKVKPLIDRFEAQMKSLSFAQAEKTADEILAVIK
jgi:hypothetical protein